MKTRSLKTQIFIALGFVWGLSQTLIGAIVCLFMLCTRDINFKRVQWPNIDFVQTDKPGLLQGLFRVWDRGRGLSLGSFCFYHKRYIDDPVLIGHERRHTYQAFVLGPFWLPAYIILYLWKKLFDKERDAYWTHPFEVDARKHSGQPYIHSGGFWYDDPNSAHVRHPEPIKKNP